MRDDGLAQVEIVVDDDDPPVEPAEATIRRLLRRQRVLAALVVVAAAGGALAGTTLAGDDGDRAGLRAASTGADDADDAEAAADDVVSEELVGRGWSEADESAAHGGGFSGAAAYGPAFEWIGSGSVSGAEVRLLRSDYGNVDDGNPFWDPPPGCVSTGSWSVQVSSERFVALLYAERYAMPDRPDGTVQLVGVAEGDPHWVAMADAGAAGATFTMPDGQQVPAADVGGRAVGVVRAPHGADVPQDETGHRASLATPGGTFELATWWFPGEAFQAEHCQPPPPELPAPGVQPDDPDAAHAAVVGALSTVFGNPDPDAKAAVLEHPDVVLAAMDSVAVNYPDITTEVEVVDVVFTAPDTAWFRYHLDADIARFDDQIGEARLVDGRWVITTETVCTQLRKGGATCEAPG